MENTTCPILTTNKALATDYLILHTCKTQHLPIKDVTLNNYRCALYTRDPTTPSRQQAQVSSTRDLTFSMF